MPSLENTGNQPDEVTLALWRAAEAGELHEVEVLLSRVTDLNACNEHGVTALMRAAQHGHAWVVRLLLAKGADANVVRNDKFTALSLAAFFGHTDVVRALMEHGADLKASTRHGTSPHMWATARTFNEVVDQLKHPAAAPKPEERTPEARTVVKPKAPKPVVKPMPAAAAVSAPVSSAIVRTLKEPPEIWDLVHEEPKGFNARSAFVGHLRSMRLTFRIATAACLIGACIVGVWVLRGVHARSEITPDQQQNQPTAAIKVQNENKTFELRSVEPVESPPAAAASDFIAPPVSTVTTESSTAATTRRRSSHSRMVRTPEVNLDPPAQPAATESVQPRATSSEKSDVKPRPTATETTKSSSPLSPQLITPAKNASTKSKVIQWP